MPSFSSICCACDVMLSPVKARDTSRTNATSVFVFVVEILWQRLVLVRDDMTAPTSRTHSRSRCAVFKPRVTRVRFFVGPACDVPVAFRALSPEMKRWRCPLPLLHASMSESCLVKLPPVSANCSIFHIVRCDYCFVVFSTNCELSSSDLISRRCVRSLPFVAARVWCNLEDFASLHFFKTRNYDPKRVFL